MHHYLPGLEIFEMGEPHNRSTIQCDHCGLDIIRHKLKVHTKIHHPGSVVRKRIKRQLRMSGFFISMKSKIDDVMPYVNPNTIIDNNDKNTAKIRKETKGKSKAEK